MRGRVVLSFYFRRALHHGRVLIYDLLLIFNLLRQHSASRAGFLLGVAFLSERRCDRLHLGSERLSLRRDILDLLSELRLAVNADTRSDVGRHAITYLNCKISSNLSFFFAGRA